MKQDLPNGVKKARKWDNDAADTNMTNDLGQFVNANNNPYPVPIDYIDGQHQEIDTRTGKPKEQEP